jgi:hypothetical protein
VAAERWAAVSGVGVPVGYVVAVDGSQRHLAEGEKGRARSAAATPAP